MNPIPTNFDTLARFLDVASLRHRVIAHNVANVNTPNYHEMEVSFEGAFQRAVRSGGLPAGLTVEPRVIESPDGGPERADGNNVDIDFEMSRLSKNTLLYRTFTQVLASYLATARSAVAGR